MKTSELTGPALDWAVAKSIGHLEAGRVVVDLEYSSGYDPVRWEPQLSTYYSSAYAPSTDWQLGGPIIEREWIELTINTRVSEGTWLATRVEGSAICEVMGPTQLIAAMRCYVKSQLGDEVDVPQIETAFGK